MAVPVAPRLRAFVVSKGKVKLTWKDVPGATGYNLYQTLTRTGAGGRNEVQTVTLEADAGDFTLTLDAAETDPIAFDATGAEVQEALEAIAGIAPGDVEVSRDGDVITIEFTGDLARTNVSTLVADDTGLEFEAGAGSAVVATSQTAVVINDDDVEAPLIDTLAVDTRGVYVLRAFNDDGESEPSNVVSLANRDY